MCKLFKLCYSCLPFIPIRDWIIRRHFSACPRCRTAFALPEPLLLLTKTPLDENACLWPGVEKKIRHWPGSAVLSPKPLWRRWGWGYATVLVLVCGMILGFFQWQAGDPQKKMAVTSEVGEAQFVLLSAQIDGEDARTYIIHPEASQMVIVFFKKT